MIHAKNSQLMQINITIQCNIAPKLSWPGIVRDASGGDLYYKHRSIGTQQSFFFWKHTYFCLFSIFYMKNYHFKSCILSYGPQARNKCYLVVLCALALFTPWTRGLFFAKRVACAYRNVFVPKSRRAQATSQGTHSAWEISALTKKVPPFSCLCKS